VQADGEKIISRKTLRQKGQRHHKQRSRRAVF